MSTNYDILSPVLSLAKETDKPGAFHVEVNVMVWYGGEPKLDIRKWNDERKTGKGISLAFQDAESILDAADRIREVMAEYKKGVSK